MLVFHKEVRSLTYCSGSLNLNGKNTRVSQGKLLVDERKRSSSDVTKTLGASCVDNLK